MNKDFLRLWLGQTVSVCGTKMTQFAMALWLFSETGLASALALLFAAGAVGTLVAQASAGLLVDRYSRKVLMIACDFCSSMLTLVLFWLAWSEQLQHWHLFVLVGLSSPLSALQGVAYRASVATMLPRRNLGRGASLATLTHYGTNIIAPAFAAAVYPFYGLYGVIALDMASFVVAMATIATVTVPRVVPPKQAARPSQPRADDTAARVSRGWVNNFRDGLAYIRQVPHLRAMLLFQMVFMAFHEVTNVLWQPLLMARSGNDPVVVAGVAMASGVSGVAVSLLLSLWGGPRNPVRAYLYASLGAGVSKTLFGASATALQWQVTQFFSSANFPVRAASYNTVWMAEVPAYRQGQVFGLSSFFVQVCMYTCFLGTALVADYILQPWLDDNPGVLGPLSVLTGNGHGAGFALLYIVGGLGMAAVSVIGLCS